MTPRRAHRAARALAGATGLACMTLALHAAAGTARAAIGVSATVAQSCTFSTTTSGSLAVRCSSGALGGVTLATASGASSTAPATGFMPVSAHRRAADDEFAHGSCEFILSGKGLARAAATAAGDCTREPAHTRPRSDTTIEASFSF